MTDKRADVAGKTEMQLIQKEIKSQVEERLKQRLVGFRDDPYQYARGNTRLYPQEIDIKGWDPEQHHGIYALAIVAHVNVIGVIVTTGNALLHLASEVVKREFE